MTNSIAATNEKIWVACPNVEHGEHGRWLSAREAKNAIRENRVCRRCHNTQIAPLGWAATVRTHGEKAAVKNLRGYRLENPSSLERAVEAQLREMGVEFEREVWFEYRDGTDKVGLLDFVLFNGVVIEVQGEYFHKTYHQDRDARKVAALNAQGRTVIEVDDAAVRAGISNIVFSFVS